MRLIIKPLTLDLTPDYLDFFDKRAFSDNNPCGPCYCTGPSMDASSERQMVKEFGNDVKGWCAGMPSLSLLKKKFTDIWHLMTTSRSRGATRGIGMTMSAGFPSRLAKVFAAKPCRLSVLQLHRNTGVLA